MSNVQMLDLLNNLSASGSSQNEYENYGVGAKISALTRNHEGIFYESWKNDSGNAVLIKYNSENNVYGIQGTTQDDGKTAYSLTLTEKSKPAIIKQHGTRVTLLGMSVEQDTMLPPKAWEA